MKVKVIVAALSAAGVIASLPQALAVDTIFPPTPPGTTGPLAQTPTPAPGTTTSFPVTVTVPGVGTSVLTLTYDSSAAQQWTTSDPAWVFNADLNVDANTAVFSNARPDGTVYAFSISSTEAGNSPPFGPAITAPTSTSGPSVGVDYNSPRPAAPVSSSLPGFAAATATGTIVGFGQTTSALKGPSYVAMTVGINPPGVPPLVVAPGPGSSSSSASSGTSPVGTAGGKLTVNSNAPHQETRYGQYMVIVPTTDTPPGTTSVAGTVMGSSGSFNSDGIRFNRIDGTASFDTGTGVTTTSPTETPVFSVDSATGNTWTAGTLGVGGHTTTNGITDSGGITTYGDLSVGGHTGTSGLTNTGALSTNTLTVTDGTVTNGIANVGLLGTGSLAVLGNSTLNGNLSVAGTTGTSGLVNTGALSTDTLTVTGASVTNGITNFGNLTNSGSVNTATLGVTGNATIGGTLSVNGATTLNGATQINNTLDVTRETNIGGVSTNNNTLSVAPGGVLINSGGLGGNSIEVNSSRTALTGGGAGLTLANGRATFGGVNGGTPLTVTGIANGQNQYDAVNYGQVQELEKDMSRGISGATAVANIPQVDQGKTFALGVGVGGFNGETAFAVGGSVRVAKDAIIKASVGFAGGGGSNTVWGVGGAYNWQ